MQRQSVDYIQAWQCVGCGRIEAPQTCIGVCQDRKAFFISRQAHESALEELAHLRRQLAATRSHLLRFSHSAPKKGHAEEAYNSLQKEVRNIIEHLPSEPS